MSQGHPHSQGNHILSHPTTILNSYLWKSSSHLYNTTPYSTLPHPHCAWQQSQAGWGCDVAQSSLCQGCGARIRPHTWALAGGWKEMTVVGEWRYQPLQKPIQCHCMDDIDIEILYNKTWLLHLKEDKCFMFLELSKLSCNLIYFLIYISVEKGIIR